MGARQGARIGEHAMGMIRSALPEMLEALKMRHSGKFLRRLLAVMLQELIDASAMSVIFGLS